MKSRKGWKSEEIKIKTTRNAHMHILSSISAVSGPVIKGFVFGILIFSLTKRKTSKRSVTPFFLKWLTGGVEGKRGEESERERGSQQYQSIFFFVEVEKWTKYLMGIREKKGALLHLSDVRQRTRGAKGAGQERKKRQRRPNERHRDRRILCGEKRGNKREEEHKNTATEARLSLSHPPPLHTPARAALTLITHVDVVY